MIDTSNNNNTLTNKIQKFSTMINRKRMYLKKIYRIWLKIVKSLYK